MLTQIETIVFSLILILTIYGFFRPLYIRYKLIRSGVPEKRLNNPLYRIWDAFSSFFFLRCSIKKERYIVGIVHIFLLYGSLTFDTVSLGHVLEGYFPDFHLYGHGFIGKAHSLVVDFFAIMVLLAAIFFIIRRYVVRPKSYDYSTWDSLIIYSLLITVTVTFLLYEGAAIALKPQNANLAFFGKAVAPLLPASAGTVKLWWWIHILNVFAFVVYVPRSKYLHMIMGPFNILFRDHEPPAIVRPLDIENAEKFGVANFRDFRWKDLMDGFACIDCGRCEDYCPAAATDKKLSPKDILINLRRGMLKHQKEILSDNMENPLPLMGNIFFEEEIWACTTCGACMHVCPVKNEHVPKLIGLRQGQVLMEGKFPAELKNTFKGMTVNGNPWDMGANNRLSWAEGLDIPLYHENPDAEYLLYLGCAVAFDDRAQKIGKSLIKFLKKHDISFGVLGENEMCCGETAKRLGEEGIGQSLMQANIELFKEMGVKKILTPCPHCFNSFRNEYPLLEGKFEVIHHTQLIQELIRKGQLKSGVKLDETVTIHDSCYLGRANEIYQPSRDILNSIDGVSVKEHRNSKEHGFCCGAGGGLFWVEEHEPRINHARVDQLNELKPSVIATSCPYCAKMLDDGIQDKELGSSVVVKDLVELLEEGSKDQ